MILEAYLKLNSLNIRQMHLLTKIPEATLRSINKRRIEKWNMEYFDAIAIILNKSRLVVIEELDNLEKSFYTNKNKMEIIGKYDISNRRYIGNKSKLTPWIIELILKNTEGSSFFDVFAGTGVMAKEMLNYCDEIILNDFLFSNEVIYEAFFGNDEIDNQKIYNYTIEFQKIKSTDIKSNYFSTNFGNKFFSIDDSKIIGEIRERIEKDNTLTKRERAILISSLLYSTDRIANTVGHYDAYRKNVTIEDRFHFELINPLNTQNKKINIYREDSNDLVAKVKCDIAFIDPPYNSRQYSRFYHVLENLTKWEKPKLSGVAMKPESENMSDYCRAAAPLVFDNLIKNLNANYIIVTYNNTYNSRSSSSRNKITHSQILDSLNFVGTTLVFEMPYQFFNAGKTDLNGHKEFVFITKVGD